MTNVLETIKAFITKYANAFCILALLLFCYLMLFQNLGIYKLIDVDETRYVNIARAMLARGDYITPFLNFEPFLEKPPLFYWMTAFSYQVFGQINEFTSRFPVALMATIGIFFTYFFAKKTMGSKIYALISSLILLSSVWVLLFSHLAILDIGFMTLTMGAIYSAVLSLFVENEKNKKYCWYFAYLFMGLAVLQKGLIGIIVPAAIVFFVFLASRKLKEIFKPLNILPGILIFAIVVVPWHYLIYKAQGSLWVNEYIIKHHFARFIDSSMGLGRKQPIYFYIPVLLMAIFPWTFSFISVCIRGIKTSIKDFKATKSFKQMFSADTNDRKVLVFAAIYLIVGFSFFSLSSTKLPTYILPILPAFALLCGYYWWGYIVDGKFATGIKISTILNSVLITIAGLVGAMLMYIVPQSDIMFVSESIGFRMFVCSWLIVMSLIAVLCLIARNRSLLFISNIVMMLGVIIIATAKIFGFVSTFGQEELENYAQKAQMVSQAKFVTFGFSEKYSVLNKYNGKVHFIRGHEVENYIEMNKIINDADKKSRPIYMVIRKTRGYDANLIKGFKILERGEKYDLYLR